MLRFLMTLVSPNECGSVRPSLPRAPRRIGMAFGLSLAAVIMFAALSGAGTAQSADEPATAAQAAPAQPAAAPADQDAAAKPEAAAEAPKPEPAADAAESQPAAEAVAPEAEKTPAPAEDSTTAPAVPEQAATPAGTPADQPAAAPAAGTTPLAQRAGPTTTVPVQTEAPAYWGAVALFLLVVVGAFVLAAVMASWLRLREYQTALTIIFLSLFASAAVIGSTWPPKLGIDLKGGVYLVYEVEEESKDTVAAATAPDMRDDSDATATGTLSKSQMDKLVAAISRRINPGGVKELVIRPYGKNQIEIVIPEVDESEIDRYKEKITSAGTLEFRILANRRDPRHAGLIEASEKWPDDRILYMRDVNGNPVRDETGALKTLGRWVPVSPESDVAHYDVREIPMRQRPMGDRTVTEVLVVNDMYNVTGGYLVRSSRGVDEQGRPNVNFMFNAKGGALFGGLTGENLPDEGHNLSRQLGIILDGYMFSAPQIRSQIRNNGQITGNFTEQEVADLVDVLNAGMLPATLSKQPISQMATGPTLGSDTIRSSSIAMGASLVMVILFMTAYYRLSGFVACAVLVANLIMTVAVMMFLKAAFTLPGMAGLVLSLGLSIDANILINERIREELQRQATLRMAIRNGFARAMSAIVDSNVTTIFTGIVLYVIGTDQIKGFAVTLCTGITLSMFTACYCARIVFEISEKKRWMKTLTMARFPLTRTIDFVRLQTPAIALSAVVIFIGLVAVFVRGKGLLDIDFTGGVSVQMVFRQDQDISLVREKLEKREDVFQDLTVQELKLRNEPPHRRFVINTARPDDAMKAEALLEKVKVTLQDTFKDQLVYHSMTITAQPGSPASKPQSPAADEAKTSALRTDLPGYDLLAAADQPLPPPAAAPPEAEKKPEAAAEKTAPADPAAESSAAQPGQKSGEEPAKPADAAQMATFNVTFGADKVTYATLEKSIKQAMEAEAKVASFEMTNPGYAEDNDPDRGYDAWKISISLPTPDAQKVLEGVKSSVESTAVFPSSNTIGGQVASDTQWKAVVAVLASFVIIIIYIWIRFERVTFGIAATIALVHDVLVTLGAIAVTTWLAPYFGFMLVEEFKIGLSVVAAFLTLMGYSLEDTIVIFDRLREIRGKTPYLNVEMFNQAINQTLSRTTITAFLVLMSVIILYVFGGPAIRVFAFAMVIGAIAGTYSTLFIASPIVLWIDRSSQEKNARKTA